MRERMMTVLLAANGAGEEIVTQTPQFVSDAVRLANDATTWLLVISAAVAVVLLIYRIFIWYQASDNERPNEQKKIKITIFGAVGVIIGEAVLKLVLSYFTH